MPVALLFSWPSYAKIMLAFPNYAPLFLNYALQKPFSLIRSLHFPFVDCGERSLAIVAGSSPSFLRES